MHLLDLVRRQRWSTLADQAKSCPHEIPTQDKDGWTVLHWACLNDPPIRAISALCRNAEDPKAMCLIQDTSGLTALHCACCQNASLAVIQELVQVCPDAVSIPDHEGWTPLHFVCNQVLGTTERMGEFHAFHIACILIGTNRAITFIEDLQGGNPLDRLLLNAFSFFEDTMTEIDKWKLTPKTGGHELRAHILTGDVEVFWRMASLLIRQFESIESELEGNDSVVMVGSPILHVVASMGYHVPVQILQFTAKLFCEQTLDRDPSGNTPLHLAALAPCAHGNSDRIAHLVAMNKDAAFIQNNDGHTPLALAIQSGKTWKSGVRTLLNISPTDSYILSLPEDCFPYLLSKIGEDGDSLNTIHQIISFNLDLLLRR
eukprot:scaffold126363_cov52-Attheya_sp.AAC.2